MGDLTLETALLSHFLYIAMVHRGLNSEYKCGFTVGNNYPLTCTTCKRNGLLVWSLQRASLPILQVSFFSVKGNSCGKSVKAEQ